MSWSAARPRVPAPARAPTAARPRDRDAGTVKAAWRDDAPPAVLPAMFTAQKPTSTAGQSPTGSTIGSGCTPFRVPAGRARW